MPQDNDSGLMAGLPENHIVHSFSHLELLKVEAEKILKWFEKNDDGNQWIVVLGLRKPTIEQLTNNHHTSLGGITYRFQWEGLIGLIKVVPSGLYESLTDRFVDIVKFKISARNIPFEESLWVGSKTYKPAVGKGREGDQAFVPPSRCSNGIRNVGRPTLVVETGVSESLPRLRQDAKKWFVDSDGEVRIVILITSRAKRIMFEKWQLAPPNSPASPQQAYCAQEVEVHQSKVDGEPHVVTGAPLVLPFVTVYDRLPNTGESDIVLQKRDFERMTNLLF
ncbi:hypothetical protein N7465_011758 [Penicillium sp. CMV-2018d]|nr:hypothetical protein N7465_011758 [Penicillium sp. CMV-2018d]